MSTENNRSTPESWKPRENEVKLPKCGAAFYEDTVLKNHFYQETSPAFHKLDCKKFLLMIFSLSSLSLEGPLMQAPEIAN